MKRRATGPIAGVRAASSLESESSVQKSDNRKGEVRIRREPAFGEIEIAEDDVVGVNEG